MVLRVVLLNRVLSETEINFSFRASARAYMCDARACRRAHTRARGIRRDVLGHLYMTTCTHARAGHPLVVVEGRIGEPAVGGATDVLGRVLRA